MSRLIQDHDFAVDDGTFGIELAGGFHKIPILCGPVEPAAREDGSVAFVADDLRAIAVEFHLVNPAIALWRLVDQGGATAG